MNPKLNVSDDLFVIPDNDQFILYEPRHTNALLVNKAVVQFLAALKQGRQKVFEANEDLVNDMIKQNIIVDHRIYQALSFCTQQSDYDPNGISLFLTTACSMRCIYCYSHGGDHPQTMPWPIAKAAVDWIVKHTLSKDRKRFHVSLHGGGEVTTAFNLMRRTVAYIRKQAINNRLTAQIDAGLNGVMSLDTADWISKNLNGATVSLDGLPAVQNAQRPLASGQASFPAVSEALQRLDKNGFNYAIRMTVTQERIHQMADSAAFIAEHFSAKSIQIEPVFLVGRALDKDLAAVDADMFVDQFRGAQEQVACHGKQLKYSGARLQTTTNVFCKAATGNSFAITPQGWVTACYEVSEPDDPRSALFFYGHFNHDKNQFVFDDEKIRRLRTLTVENKAYCDKCFCKWHCAGDCPAKLAALGDAWSPDERFRCHINRELTKDQIKDLLNHPQVMQSC